VGHDSGGSGVAVAPSPATGVILEGQRVRTIPGTGGDGLEGVACPLANLCVAVGENSGRSAGVAVPLNPATGAIRRGQGVQDVAHKGILSTSPARRPLCAWLSVGEPANRRWPYRSTRERARCQRAKAIDPYRLGRQC
jgi:hypothetical protein